MQRGVDLATVALRARKLFMSEHPVSHGRGSLLHSYKLDMHSTMHQTTAFAALISEFALQSVYTDQGASGHTHRKTTDLLCDPVLYRACMPVLGVLRLPDTWVSSAPPLSGKKPDGSFVTKAAEIYPLLFSERLARVWLVASTLTTANVEGGEQGMTTTAQSSQEEAESTHEKEARDDDVFANGDRIEVYWTKDKCWYAGKVTGISKREAT